MGGDARFETVPRPTVDDGKVRDSSFALGFDYLYRVDPKWEVGFQLDLNYDRSFDERESDAIVPIGSYSISNRLPLFFGVGLERARSTGETFWLTRIGFEYSFFLDDRERVSLLPGAFLDHIHGETLLSAVVAIGFQF